MVIMSKFNAEKTLDYIGKYHISFVIGVPTVLEDLADAQEDRPRDLSSLRGIVTMGSPLEKASCIRYQKVLTHNIFNGYGTTETFWNTFLRPFDLPEYAGTAGASCIVVLVILGCIYTALESVHKLSEVHELVADNFIVCIERHLGAVALCHLEVANFRQEGSASEPYASLLPPCSLR